MARKFYRYRIKTRRSFRRYGLMKSRMLFRKKFNMRAAMTKNPRLKKEVNTAIQAGVFTCAGSSFAFVLLTPTNISEGSGSGNRTGQRVKFLAIRYEIEGLLGQDVLDLSTAPVRIVLCSPKNTNITAFETHMGLQTHNTFVNHNIVNVYHDQCDTYQQADSLTTTVKGITGKGRFIKRGILKFPRLVNFAPGATTIDDPNDIVYLWVYNGQIGATAPVFVTRYRAKLTYVDV